MESQRRFAVMGINLFKERKDNNNTKKETNDILTINLENLKSQDYDTNYKKTIKILNEYFTW